MRYEYKIVRVGEGFFGIKGDATEDYKVVIEQHAKEGWRFVQAFAPPTLGHGLAPFIDLIFEKRRD